MRVRGTPVNSPSVPSELRDTLSSLGDANLAKRGVSLGTGEHGSLLGKIDAVYARVAIPSSPATVDVPHSLGRVPAQATLWEIVQGPSGDCVVVVSSVAKKDWTSTTIKVRIDPISGTTSGAEAVLIVS